MKTKPYSKKIIYYFLRNRFVDAEQAAKLAAQHNTNIDSDGYCLFYVPKDGEMLVETYDTETDITTAIERHIEFQNKIKYIFHKGRRALYSLNVDIFDL